MDSSPTKAEDGERRSSGYKSWKKKYRKMRIVFDQKMQQGEELHRQEERAAATVKRLAVENDRLLDLLLEVNNSPQVPPGRRVDVALDEAPADPEAPARPRQAALKRLRQLLGDVPHSTYAAARLAHRPYVADLVGSDGEAHPASFLSGDDVDRYMHAIDAALDPETDHVPGPALVARPPLSHVKNPTSVTNWLRKHAPKIFLQDAEHHHASAGEHHHADDADGGSGAGAHANAHANAHAHAHSHTGARKPRAARAERGARTGSRGGKRASAAARLAAAADRDASMDDDADFGAAPVVAAVRGKRKRDDDPGYRPGGSTSRPAKKKRKSEGDGTPGVRKSKKEAAKEAAKGAAKEAAKED